MNIKYNAVTLNCMQYSAYLQDISVRESNRTKLLRAAVLKERQNIYLYVGLPAEIHFN